MVAVRHFVSPAALPPPAGPDHITVLTYNVLLPNSQGELFFDHDHLCLFINTLWTVFVTLAFLLIPTRLCHHLYERWH